MGSAGRQTWPALDRWILSRVARLAAEVEEDLADYDALDAARAIDGFVEELSTWYLRRSRDRMRPSADPADREQAFATLHAALVALARILAPILPFLSESMYQNLVVASVDRRPARQRPPDQLAGRRAGRLFATRPSRPRWPW